jgi:Rps23 Pro-64 3,4-dihydroxylase Tpa1-like proline 4-hydroxylase
LGWGAESRVTELGVRRSLVVPDFFAEAEALRDTFDQRFVRGRSDDPRSFVWDYWHVPGQYTYHRTHGNRYFPEDLTTSFLNRLRSWGREVLGCTSVRLPWLSYYVDGCVQELHADVPHGPWAYVFSLTRWESRGFSGGETLLLRPEALDFWRGFDPANALEAGDFAEQIPTAFNQLTVFDARIPHGVRMVQGTRDPLDSRIVLHGWFSYPELTLSDDLENKRSRVALELAIAHISKRLAGFGSVTGLLTVRLEFADDGGGAEGKVLSNTVVSTSGDREAPGEVIEAVLDSLSDVRVAGAGKSSWAILPFRIPSGG